jgi:asparagine synthetase B (glutamine-hydrolysing)
VPAKAQWHVGFLIYDRRRNIIFGSRDRFGVKPLFMHRGKGQILFASEIKAIRASGLYSTDFNWGTIADFLVRQRLDETDRTFCAGIEQIPPGTAFRSRRDPGRTIRGCPWLSTARLTRRGAFTRIAPHDSRQTGRSLVSLPA